MADACYLQIFSPLLGAQAGEYDNYEKHQKKLALGHFSVHYGSFGTGSGQAIPLEEYDFGGYTG